MDIGFMQFLDELATVQLMLIALCSVLIGMSKTGLSGAGMIVVPLMAGIFGSQKSTGIVLPLLCIADIFAVLYYHRHASWKYILKLIPWTIAGVAGGVIFGNKVNDKTFSIILVIIVLTGIVLMIFNDLKNKSTHIPDYWWFSVVLGIAGGFTSMVGNAAGPVMVLYLLSMRLPKNEFIGTGAWFFMILNLIKVPLHIFSWGTITVETLKINITCIPFILIGIITGIYLVKLFSEKAYRYFIILSTVLSAIFLVF